MKATCQKCGYEKHISEFYRNRTVERGRDSTCKQCRNETRVSKLGHTPKRKCKGCGDRFRLDCFPWNEGRLTRSYWCQECTDIAASLKRTTPEHRRYLASSERIARTEEERQAWIDEGAEALRANTDAVRPVRGER